MNPLQAVSPQQSVRYKNQPRFGAKQHLLNIEGACLPLSSHDVLDLTPASGFVDRFPPHLIGDTDDTNWAVLIPNTLDILKTIERARRFAVNLAIQLFERCRTQLPIQKPHYEVVLELRDTIWDKTPNTDPHPDGEEPDLSPLLLSFFGPFQDIAGGIPQLTDGRKLSRDTGIPFVQLFRRTRHGNWMPKPVYLDPLVDYTETLPALIFDPTKMPLLVMNNTRDGILHARTPVSCLLPTAERPRVKPVRTFGSVLIHLTDTPPQPLPAVYWDRFYTHAFIPSENAPPGKSLS